MENKYKLTEETTNVYDRMLHRIEALKDFGNVKKGDKGGFIENEENLSQYRNCWIYGNAKVCEDALVRDDAEVYGNAEISGNVLISDNAKIDGNAEVFGNAEVLGDAKIYGCSRVSDDACINKCSHILNIGPIGSRNEFTTFFRTKDRKVKVSCGCFLGTIDEFLEKVEQTHGDSKHAIVYKAAADIALAQIGTSDEDDT